MSASEGEIQTLLNKLAFEEERNTRLSVELQEGHTGNEVWDAWTRKIITQFVLIGF